MYQRNCHHRTKTRSRRDDKAEMFVKIDPLVKDLIKEYRATKSKLAFSFSERYSSYQIFGENVNEGLAKFCTRIGYSGKVTLYGARHSWASIAYKAGVEKGLINDGLCHVDKTMKVTDIYINKDWSVLWKANMYGLARMSAMRRESWRTSLQASFRLISRCNCLPCVVMFPKISFCKATMAFCQFLTMAPKNMLNFVK